MVIVFACYPLPIPHIPIRIRCIPFSLVYHGHKLCVSALSAYWLGFLEKSYIRMISTSLQTVLFAGLKNWCISKEQLKNNSEQAYDYTSVVLRDPLGSKDGLIEMRWIYCLAVHLAISSYWEWLAYFGNNIFWTRLVLMHRIFHIVYLQAFSPEQKHSPNRKQKKLLKYIHIRVFIQRILEFIGILISLYFS